MKQRLSELERKADTRRKIQLGGLIIKAGMAEEGITVLLGLLMEAAEYLVSEKADEIRLKWQLKGEVEFKDQ